ncbi:MAG TPA: DNA methyltransferase, partial [Pelolinea sp.]|nr:DNA methyltransferase [Pelolinea sp.]
ILGDCREKLKEFPDNYFDSVVTDSPYEIGFMNKAFDKTGVAYDVDMWKKVLRVLKPGGHLLSFGGSRTYHRMACAIEDAGFEIRDQIQYLYGSGFPKSYNIGKGMDKRAGVEREKLGIAPTTRANTDVDNQILNWGGHGNGKIQYITAPATPEAQQWDGWGSALKPANEPICLARKPMSEKTIVENVLKWGVGGLNIGGCRIELNGEIVPINVLEEWSGFGQLKRPSYEQKQNNKGRWPANLILDEEAGRLLDEQSGIEASRFYYSAKASRSERNAGLEGMGEKENLQGLDVRGRTLVREDGSKTLVERWKSTPAQNHHPTVKPISLMRYLCRLITPPGGVVLDHFMGSGSTICAAVLEGFDSIGIDNDAEYFEIAKCRIEYWQAQKEKEDIQIRLPI